MPAPRGRAPRRARRRSDGGQYGSTAPEQHGVLRVILTLDGETVVDAQPDIGYLHTGIEKTIQCKCYQAALTCTDRMDYLSPLANNLVYCLAVERLLEVAVPERATWLRVMLGGAAAHRQPSGMAGYQRPGHGRHDTVPLLFPRTRADP